MLRAILEGKAGRFSFDGESVTSWRDIFNQREDLLTAVFFGRLRYLSQEGEDKVLALLLGEEAQKSLGEIQEMAFWPKLPVSNIENRTFVEPDVLIICENAAILIEVKPPMWGYQSEEQWRNEIKSLVQQKEDEDSEWDVPGTIHFLALGRNANIWQSHVASLEGDYSSEGLRIHMKEWEAVHHGIYQLFNTEMGRDAAVYADWLEAFALFGLIERPLPLSDLLTLQAKISNNWHQLFADPVVPNDKQTTEAVDWLSIATLASKINQLEISLWQSLKLTQTI